MKRFFLILLFTTISILSFAQADYGKYSMQHSSSEVELQKYVGQRVMMFSYDKHNYYNSKDCDGYDEAYFNSIQLGYMSGTVYTIKKIKVGRRIIIFLVSEYGEKIRAEVNIDGARDYKAMQTCKSFFLIDEFQKDKQEMLGKSICNAEGQSVAKIIDFKMVAVKDSYPKPCLVIQSELDGSIIMCTEDEAQELFKPLGTIISSPKVKWSFKVVGIKADDKEPFSSTIPEYNLQNTAIPSMVRTKAIINPEESVFKEDLAYHYVSVLSKVEKPSNPSIRYGKTTVVKDDKITKYSYADNIIDIDIFGDSTQFYFILKNVSDNSLKVIWNEAAFVDLNGITSKIMHAGTKYSVREGDQPATTIIKGAKIEDIAIPNCNVRYYDDIWQIASMYPKEPSLSPGQLKLMLPIQIKDVINEYVFVFDVKYVHKHPERLNLSN